MGCSEKPSQVNDSYAERMDHCLIAMFDPAAEIRLFLKECDRDLAGEMSSEDRADCEACAAKILEIVSDVLACCGKTLKEIANQLYEV